MLERWSERDVFPMKVHVPLLMTLYAQLLVADYRPCGEKEAPDEWFDVPTHYAETDMSETLDKLSAPRDDFSETSGSDLYDFY